MSDSENTNVYANLEVFSYKWETVRRNLWHLMSTQVPRNYISAATSIKDRTSLFLQDYFQHDISPATRVCFTIGTQQSTTTLTIARNREHSDLLFKHTFPFQTTDTNPNDIRSFLELELPLPLALVQLVNQYLEKCTPDHFVATFLHQLQQQNKAFIAEHAQSIKTPK